MVKAGSMKKFRRWAIRLIIALTLIIGAAWLIENYRGYQRWEEAQKRAAKLGVSLDLDDYAAPTIPDSKNLLKNPDFATEWNGEIEPQLERWTSMKLDVPNSRGILHQRGELMDYLQLFPDESDPMVAIEKLTIATKDVEARLNKLTEIILSYPPRDLSLRIRSLFDSTEVLDEIFPIKKIVVCLGDQAILALHRNEPLLAARNCEAIERLIQNFSSPDILRFLFTNSFRDTIRRVSQEGILLQAWKPEHLESLSNLLTTEVDRMQLANALSYEAAFVPTSIEEAKAFEDMVREKINDDLGNESVKPLSTKDKIQRWIVYDGPKGWEHSRKAFVLYAILNVIETGTEWKWKERESNAIDRGSSEEDKFSFDPLTFYRDTERGYSNSLIGIFEKTAKDRLCFLAIEIEKFRLAKGAYPTTLGELPKGLPLIDPTDPQKRPFRYELLPAGGFQIYSAFLIEQYPDSKRKQYHWKFPAKR